MSNTLSVMRVRIQEINEKGMDVGEPTYGIVASNNEVTAFTDGYNSVGQLNNEIFKHGCILAVIPGATDLFLDYDSDKIGTNNFEGKDWEKW